ncbi:DUF192 domain-containing protein [Tropicibacter sp. R15_0]|nr:DUF192 domain-containing protein [Tropicibacter sp. R15_0]
MGSSPHTLNRIVKTVAFSATVSLVTGLPSTTLADGDTSEGAGAPIEGATAPLIVPAPGIAPPAELLPLVPDQPVTEPDANTVDDPEQVETPDAEGDVVSADDAAEKIADQSETPKPTCPEDVLWLRGEFGKARFTVDVANTRDSRAQGLMHVESMPASKGMLFVYEFPREVAFWMKNTLVPLDIIYADERGVVQSIHANAVPGDLTPLPGEGLIQYVLEINGGMAKALGILPGTQIQHPAISNPAWPCS